MTVFKQIQLRNKIKNITAFRNDIKIIMLRRNPPAPGEFRSAKKLDEEHAELMSSTLSGEDPSGILSDHMRTYKGLTFL